jgi:hypothetical protein
MTKKIRLPKDKYKKHVDAMVYGMLLMISGKTPAVLDPKPDKEDV